MGKGMISLQGCMKVFTRRSGRMCWEDMQGEGKGVLVGVHERSIRDICMRGCMNV